MYWLIQNESEGEREGEREREKERKRERERGLIGGCSSTIPIMTESTCA